MMTRMCDLPHDLVSEKILAKVPITSLRAVRSTCKLWESLSKDLIVGKATTRQHEFLGFMTMCDKVYLLRFDLQGIHNDDLVDPSIKQVALLDQVEISKVFHSQGLVLSVMKDNSKLVVWNPYLGQTRWIGPRTTFNKLDRYALGYDKNRNHKILRLCCDVYDRIVELEIYDFSSNSWRVLDVLPECEIGYYQSGVTLKGNTYFYAKVTAYSPLDELVYVYALEFDNFLLCFDFTRERFGQRLPLPFNSESDEDVTLSWVGEEKLAVLFDRWYPYDMLEIWVTNMIEPKAVSWSKFLKFDMTPLIGFLSFFIDEEKKVVVVFNEDGYDEDKTDKLLTAYVIGEDGYFKSVSLDYKFYLALLSSTYLPSLVQIKKPRKSKRNTRERDA